MVKISYRNSKMGKGMSVSLPPIKTCIKDAPCKNDCYALKMMNTYAATCKEAWKNNLREYMRNPASYFAEISQKISTRSPKLFRWNVAGDIPDEDYLRGIVQVAMANPKVQFLVFTKNYKLIKRHFGWIIKERFDFLFPKNLHIRLSAWPGLELHNPLNLPVAYMQDGTETRIPENAIHCKGGCDKCQICFSSDTTPVWFSKH